MVWPFKLGGFFSSKLRMLTGSLPDSLFLQLQRLTEPAFRVSFVSRSAQRNRNLPITTSLPAPLETVPYRFNAIFET